MRFSARLLGTRVSVRTVGAAFATGLLVLAPAASAQTIPREFIYMGDQLLVYQASFVDVLPSSAFYSYVNAMGNLGITSGCGPSQYCPGQSVTRDVMAVFLLTAKHGSSYAPPPCGAIGVFADVPPSNPYCRWIEELARRGVVGGCGGGNYCPTAPVTREQMSVFLLLTLNPNISPPACVTPTVFTDVPATSPFCRWVEELVRRRITGGCGPGLYCPTVAVSREQMAAFLVATFTLPY